MIDEWFNLPKCSKSVIVYELEKLPSSLVGCVAVPGLAFMFHIIIMERLYWFKIFPNSAASNRIFGAEYAATGMAASRPVMLSIIDGVSN